MNNAEEVAKRQAAEIAEDIGKEGPTRIYFREKDARDRSDDPKTYIDLKDTQVVALIAYVQRLGVKEAKPFGPVLPSQEKKTDAGEAKPVDGINNKDPKGNSASATEPKKVMP